MQRRGFFSGLAVLVMAPSVLIRKQKTEKHWVCLGCGEPVGDPKKVEHVKFSRGPAHPGDFVFRTNTDETVRIYGDPSDSCSNCGAHISCTVWK